MADLLECLLQIKALRETLGRLKHLAVAAPAANWGIRPAPQVWAPVEVVAHLADMELVFGVRVRQILTVERPGLLSVDPPALAMRADYKSWSLSARPRPLPPPPRRDVGAARRLLGQRA